MPPPPPAGKQAWQQALGALLRLTRQLQGLQGGRLLLQPHQQRRVVGQAHDAAIGRPWAEADLGHGGGHRHARHLRRKKGVGSVSLMRWVGGGGGGAPAGARVRRSRERSRERHTWVANGDSAHPPACGVALLQGMHAGACKSAAPHACAGRPIPPPARVAPALTCLPSSALQRTTCLSSEPVTMCRLSRDQASEVTAPLPWAPRLRTRIWRGGNKWMCPGGLQSEQWHALQCGALLQPAFMHAKSTNMRPSLRCQSCGVLCVSSATHSCPS